MGEWGFWEWLGYATISVAALMIALDQGIKQSPDLNARFGRLLATRLWAFTPFTLILVSGIIIAARHLGGNDAPRPQAISSPSAPIPQASAALSPPVASNEARVFV